MTLSSVEMASSTLIEGKDGKIYSDEFLTEVRELNQALFRTLRSTLEKTPFADCRTTVRDYITHYDTVESRYGIKSQSSSGKRSGPLLENNMQTTKNVKFASNNDTVVIKDENEKNLSSHFGSTATTKIKREISESSSGTLPRTVGTTSLLNSIEMPFNFKPSGDSNSTNTGASMPLMNLFPSKPTISAEISNESSGPSPPKFSFQPIPSTTGQSTAGISTTTGAGFPSASTTQNKPFSFSFGAKPFPTASSETTGVEAGDDGADDEDDTPPEPEKVEVKEEGSLYEKPCQLYFKPKGDSTLHEKGAGVLFLKKVESGSGIQLLVRACNALRTVLLNILLTEKLPLNRHGKQSVRLMCAPNPPIATGGDKPIFADFFFKCDNDKEAQELFDRLDKERKAISS